MANGVWLIGTHSKVKILGLKDDAGAYINSITLAGVLKLKDAVVAGAESISFTYVSSSNGNYEGVLPADLDLKAGKEYHMYVTGIKDGKKITARIKRQAAFLDL